MGSAYQFPEIFFNDNDDWEITLAGSQWMQDTGFISLQFFIILAVTYRYKDILGVGMVFPLISELICNLWVGYRTAFDTNKKGRSIHLLILKITRTTGWGILFFCLGFEDRLLPPIQTDTSTHFFWSPKIVFYVIYKPLILLVQTFGFILPIRYQVWVIAVNLAVGFYSSMVRCPTECSVNILYYHDLYSKIVNISNKSLFKFTITSKIDYYSMQLANTASCQTLCMISTSFIYITVGIACLLFLAAIEEPTRVTHALLNKRNTKLSPFQHDFKRHIMYSLFLLPLLASIVFDGVSAMLFFNTM